MAGTHSGIPRYNRKSRKGRVRREQTDHKEADRGLQSKEDGVYQPIEMEVTLKPGETFSFMAATSPINKEVSILILTFYLHKFSL